MDAIALLKSQHRSIEKLLSKLEGAKGATRQSLFEEMADQLAAHIAIEERQFYPAIQARRTEDILLESLEEHLGIKRVLADLLETSNDDETYDAKVKVLKDHAVHHHSEEEDELFPKAKKVLGQDELETLGAKMRVRFASLVAGHPRKEVPAATATATSL